MGLLDGLGDVAGWLKDSPVGQVVDVAFSPVEDDSDLKKIADAIARFTVVGNVRDTIMPAVGNVFEGLDTAWNQGTRPFKTANIQVGELADGQFGQFLNPDSWKKTWQISDEVSLGQTATSGGLIGGASRVGARLGNQLNTDKERQEFYKAQPWLSPDFDISDPKQRDLAFKSNIIGKMLSGGTDLLSRWYFDPGNIATFGAGRLIRARNIKTGRLITSDNVDTALEARHTERVLDWIEAEKAAGGDVAARLFDHPGLRRNSHGAYIATALADAKDRETARAVLGTLYGSKPALEKLKQLDEGLHDRFQLLQLEAIGLERFRTVGDPMGVTDEFIAQNVPERLAMVEREMRRIVDEKQLNQRTIGIAKLFQGERALDYGPAEQAFISSVRHDVYQKGGSNRILRFIKPAVSMAPHKMVNVNRPNSALQVERFLRKTRAPIEKQDELLNDYMRAITPAERAAKLVAIEEYAINYALRDLDDETRRLVLEAASKGRADSVQALATAERRYSGNLSWSLVKVQNGAEEIHYPLLVSQTQDIVPMVDIGQLNRTVDRYGSTIKLLLETNPAASVIKLAPWIADRFYRLWKPAVLLRPAWPIRVIGDENLRIIGKLNGIAHADWGRLGQAELSYVQRQRAPKTELVPKGKRFGITQYGPKDIPEDRLDPADLTPYARGGRRPIDEEYANGEVTEEQFIAFFKRQANQRGFVPAGYEDIWVAWQRGDLTEEEFAAQVTLAAQLRHNQFAFGRSDAERIHRQVLDKDGATVDINTGSSPIKGYAVSTRPDLTEIVPKAEFDVIGPGLIEQFIAKNRTELLKPGRTLGVWVDKLDGERVVYLDVSRVVDNPETARKIGKLANQRSYADLETLAKGYIDEPDAAFPDAGGTGTLDVKPWQSREVQEEEFRRIQERIAYETGEEVRPMDYDPLKGAYIGIADYKGYQYAGPFGAGADPNYMWDLSSSRGALRLLAEHYERDGIHQASNKLRNWKSISPGEKGYEAGWEVAVNQQLAMDPLARQFLQGKSYDEVLSWLRRSEEGLTHRKTLPVRGQNPEEWVGMVEDMVHTYAPTDKLKRLALEQRARYDDLKEEVGLDALPVVHGEELANALGTGDFWQWYEKWTGKLFEFFGGKPTDFLSRHPYFATMYHAKIRQAIDTSIKQGESITPDMLTNLERMGREFALSETKKLLYDLAEQSDLAGMMRFLAPFYGAWQETLTRWAGIAYENPQVISRAHLIWDSPNAAGLVYDRQTGEPIYDPHSGVELKDQVIRLRLPKWATRDIPGAEFIPGAELVQWLITFGGNAEGATLSKSGFNLVAAGEPWWLPGVGPTVQIPVNQIIKDKPEWQETPIGRYLLPYGATNTGSPMGSAVYMALPAAYRRISQIPQDEGSAVFGNMKLRIFTTELAKYNQGLRADKPTWKEATRKAQALFGVWALATWVSPTGIAPISPVEPYVIEYRALLAADQKKDKTDPNYKSPDAIFLERYGEELFALTGSLTESMNGAPATLGAYKASKKYERLIQQVSENGSPELAGLLIGAEGAGEFNYSVYQYQLNNDTYPGSGVKQRIRFTSQEKVADRAAAAGWIEYRKIMDMIEHERVSRGLSSLQVNEAADLRFLKSTLIENLREQNPEWGLDYDQVDRGVMRRRIENLRSALRGAPELGGRQDIKGVQEYLEIRDQIVLMLRGREAKTLDAQANADLKFLFDTLVGNLVEQNLAFQAAYYRYLERDVVSASDKIGGQ